MGAVSAKEEVVSKHLRGSLGAGDTKVQRHIIFACGLSN